MITDVILDNVCIGIPGDNGECNMPFMPNCNNYFSASECFEYSGKKITISHYEIVNYIQKIKMFSTEGRQYWVNSLSYCYVQSLEAQLLRFKSIANIIGIRKNKKSYSISDLSLFTKISGTERLIPPINEINIYGRGNIVNCHGVKMFFKKTSIITEINTLESVLETEQEEYNIMSFSENYLEFLQKIIYETEEILKIYQSHNIKK